MDVEQPLTAVQWGVGPIGGQLVEAAAGRGIEFVGAVDIDPEKVGRDLGDVAGLDRELGVTVTDDPEALQEASPDVVFHATGSSLAGVRPQIETALAARADVVSTCEELAYPFRDHPDEASALDEVARSHERSCLGTGINPGFVMDALPAFLSAPMDAVESVRVERVQDAAQRRGPLQRKVGAGLSPDRFETEIAEGAGHVGSRESVDLLAAALGWTLTDIEESIEPVLAETAVGTDHVDVAPGEVAGISQVARGLDGEAERITLDLRMYVGAEDPHDRVVFDGRPAVSVTVEGGYHGDIATAAVVRNLAPRVVEAPPGLRTMLDLRLPHFRRPN